MSAQALYTQEINASLDTAWAVVGDFGSLLKWVVGGDEGSITLSGEGVGMHRDFYLPSVGNVAHRLDELDHERHRLTYSLTKGKPLGMDGYSVTVTLTATGADKCRLDWVGDFTPVEGADAEEMSVNLANAYKDLTVRLEALLKG